MSNPADPLLVEILTHLAKGWHGWVRILARATEAGARLPPAEVDRLEQMQQTLAGVIAAHRGDRPCP